ncbi:MAG: metallophosphoesterase [Bacteroidales bacterium]
MKSICKMRSLSLVVVLCFLSPIILPGIFPVAIWAQSAASLAKHQKIYKDGPYLFLNPDNSVRMIACEGFSSRKTPHTLLDTVYSNLAVLGDFKVADDKGHWSFTVKNASLRGNKKEVGQLAVAQNKRDANRFKTAAGPNESLVQHSPLASGEKIFTISDSHGNFKNFIAILKKGGVINENLEWNYGKSKLVIIGDTFDRGNDVLAILWLIYTLEEQASAVGGTVSYLLGNHDNMVLKGDLRYIKSKYKKLQDTLKMPYQQFFSAQTLLGNWLRSKKSIEIIGNTLFVHGGISSAFAKSGISIERANRLIGKYLDTPKSLYAGATAAAGTAATHEKSSGAAGTAAIGSSAAPVAPGTNDFRHSEDTLAMVQFLFGSDGPLWYRGLVSSKPEYNPITEPELAAILKQYGVARIVVGHTTFEGIQFHHNGKVISVDSKNEALDIDHLAQGLQISGNTTGILSLNE